MLYKIRVAELTDIRDVFNLSNSIDVRENSINTREIRWEDHVEWFSSKIVSEDCVYFIIRSHENKFIGQIRFDKTLEEKQTYIVSISLHKDFRGKGLGSKLLLDCSNELLDNFDAKTIYAYINRVNQPSLKSFSRIGYSIVGNKIYNGLEFLKLKYDRK